MASIEVSYTGIAVPFHVGKRGSVAFIPVGEWEPCKEGLHCYNYTGMMRREQLVCRIRWECEKC